MYKYLLIILPTLVFSNPLEKSYDFITAIKDNELFFKDGSKLLYDDKIKKTLSQKIKNPDIEDMLFLKYSKNPSQRTDAGRIRNEVFFKKLYGKDREEIEKNLVPIRWLPKHTNITLLINKNEKCAEMLQKISKELDNLPQNYMKYIINPSGSYNYRHILGTNRLSAHSYGIAIDITSKYGNYWKWDKNFKYKNRIPLKIVNIFEKYGFIWGGRWYHYDTIHFEYRPELLQNQVLN